MMQFSLPLLLCGCVIVLVSLEEIVCPLVMDFVIENFSTSDFYGEVVIQGGDSTERFVFRKKKRQSADFIRTHVVRIPDILPASLKQEDNCPSIVSFSVYGVSADYNIKFKSEEEAELFVKSRVLPAPFRIRWAILYWNWRPVIIAYDYFNTGDLGFKILDNGDYTNEFERLDELPYLFARSDIRREIRTTPPQTLYLRNQTSIEDYEIQFRSIEDLDTFLNLFPKKIYNESQTVNYYFMPYDVANSSVSNGKSE